MAIRKNISKPLRTAYYAALQNITYNGEVVPVADGFLAAEPFSDHHIIISSINETDDSPDSSYDDEVVVNVDIVSMLVNGYTRDIVDDLEGEVLAALSAVEGSKIIGGGLQITGLHKVGSDYLEEQGDNGNIIRKIVRMGQRIIQQ